MTEEQVMSMGFQAMKVALMIASPILLSALVAGLVVSILQASTQINEMTLSFIPKILLIAIVIVSLGPWMLRVILDYMLGLFSTLPYMIR
ncbi:TPA: flagellar biosynthesis protein FliQ [Salmonella enterica subsp. enterica serovar Muenchen]|nr:flagellar biosynthesis protein FliQ [Salmonella enterica]EJH1054371.1 flagellar biosynthesis protein FliQ [Salmonella enterica]HEC7758614.1 flagellar biosynthesis protein FliQ [Salmonella enterica subsp. enterica serovar Muenchen]HEC8860510.1 flagellar biosynthesis protein FliQ [Salmonella enterica subsp. enterica serovar Muenchen]